VPGDWATRFRSSTEPRIGNSVAWRRFVVFSEIALANGKASGPNAAIVLMGKRGVNGVVIWLIETETTFNKNPMVHCGYYDGGKHSSVQILTYTAKEPSPKHERDFTEFLNGLSASE